MTDDSAADPGSGPAAAPTRGAIVAGTAVAVLVAVNGWLVVRDYQVRRTDEVHRAMVQAGRQGAVNLTTIDFERVDDDVQRILDSSTGAFRDDFDNRRAPFVDAARKAQSKSVGTVAEAGLESADGDTGRVLVALTVMTSNRGVPERAPRGWRMRVTVVEERGEFKVAAVEFVQ